MSDWRDEIEPATFRVRSGEKKDVLVEMKPTKHTNEWDRTEWRFPVVGMCIEGYWHPVNLTWKVCAHGLMAQLAKIPFETACIHVECYGEKKETIYSITAHDGVITARDLKTKQTPITEVKKP